MKKERKYGRRSKKKSALKAYRLFDRVIQHRVMSIGKPNTINSTFYVLLFWLLCRLLELVRLQQMLLHRFFHFSRLCRRHHDEHERLLLATIAYVDSLDTRNICYNDTFSTLPLPTEYSPSNCNKSENLPTNLIYWISDLFQFRERENKRNETLTSWHTQKPHLGFKQWRQKNNFVIGFKWPQAHT